MQKQVRVIRSSTNMYALDFMKQYDLRFWRTEKPDRRRYDVWRGSSIGNRTYLGEVFCHGGTWAFVPFPCSDVWYFGDTRADAISGYLKVASKEVIRNDV